MRKYSENFERDYNFYKYNIGTFTFCGTLNPKFEPIHSPTGKSAKEVFFLIDSTGKNQPTCEPDILRSLLQTKASVNFHIKQWAEGRADATLPWSEFAGDGLTLEWRDTGRGFIAPVNHFSLARKHRFPDWVINAVEAQKLKILKAKS